MLEVIIGFTISILICFVIILSAAIDNLWFGGYFASKVQNFIRRK